MGAWMSERVAYPPDDLYVSRTRAVVGGDSVDHPYDVPLYHADIVDMAVLLGHLEEVLNEIHDVGASVHVILCGMGWSAFMVP